MKEATSAYVRQLYETITDSYTELYFEDESDVPLVDELLADVQPGGRILDLGCGPGTFSRYVAAKGFVTVGVDLTPSMVVVARERVPGCEFHEMDMRSLAFEDDSFDGALAAYFLIHIPSVEIPAVLLEFARVLRPGGRLGVIVQLGEPDHIAEDDVLAPRHKVFFNFFTPARLTNELEKAGFEAVMARSQPSTDPVSMSPGLVWAMAKTPVPS